jgi:hypothetical protein
MGTSMANPQAAAPAPDQGGGGGAQANPLQTILGRIAMACRTIGQQNTVIQPEMQQAASAIIQALQKSSQAAPGAPSPLQAPPQG